MNKPFIKVYYGWWILVCAVLTQFVSTSTGQMVAGVFLGPLVDDLGLQVWQFAMAVSAATAAGGIAVVLLGPLVDRVGPRKFMLIGALFASLGLFGISQQSSIWHFALFQTIGCALGWTLFGPLVINATLTKFFVARRGWALAIGSSGVSLAGIITPITMTAFVDGFGWRAGYMALAVAILVIIIPVAFVMRRRPEDLGLLPDGAGTIEQAGPVDDKVRSAIAADDRQTYTRRQAFRTSGFWLLAIGYGLNGAALGSVAMHAIPFASSIGFSRALAATGMSINGIGNLSSKAVWGWCLQRFDARRIAGVALSISATGVLTMVLASFTHNTINLLIGFFLYGFGFGGTIPISEFLWARYFGRRNIASVRGFGRPIAMIFGTGGPIVTGLWFDLSGSYTTAFMMLASVYLMGATIINISKDPPPLGDQTN